MKPSSGMPTESGVWYFDWHQFPTSHICSWKIRLSLSMSSAPSDPSVLISPSCLFFSLLSFSSFTLEGGGEWKKEWKEDIKKVFRLYLHTRCLSQKLNLISSICMNMCSFYSITNSTIMLPFLMSSGEVGWNLISLQHYKTLWTRAGLKSNNGCKVQMLRLDFFLK